MALHCTQNVLAWIEIITGAFHSKDHVLDTLG